MSEDFSPAALFDLTGTVAIVTGASGWLGRAFTLTLASAGASTLAVARDRVRLDAAIDGVPAEVRQRILTRACDVTGPDWPDCVAQFAAESGRLDTLVNNAHLGHGGSLRTSTPEDFRAALDISVVAASTAINAARPGFAASRAAGGRPSVVNVSSMYAVVSPDPGMYASEEGRNPPHYGAAKAALLQLTRYAAVELGPDGVRVNALVPGPFPQHPDTMDPGFVAELARRTALGEYGRPRDLAAALLSLVAPSAPFTTGSSVVVDGGWTVR